MTKVTETCTICGRLTPFDTSCVFCAGVTDRDINSFKQEYLQALDTVGSEEPLPYPVSIVVQQTNKIYKLNTRKIKIGRGVTNQITIPDDTFASRNHAWIIFEDDQFWLEDLGSTNGSMLNGHPVESRQVLSSGDKIRVGHTELTFEIDKT